MTDQPTERIDVEKLMEFQIIAELVAGFRTTLTRAPDGAMSAETADAITMNFASRCMDIILNTQQHNHERELEMLRATVFRAQQSTQQPQMSPTDALEILRMLGGGGSKKGVR